MAKSHEPVLFYHGNCDNDAARVALVSVSVESALLGYGVEIYNQVVDSLEKNMTVMYLTVTGTLNN